MGIIPRHLQTAENAAVVDTVQRKKVEQIAHGFLRIMLTEQRARAGHGQRHQQVVIFITGADIADRHHRQFVGHVEQTCDIFGAFQITRHPVQFAGCSA
ncbi:hypothetical protein D3C80_1954220 [compost metagenome]